MKFITMKEFDQFISSIGEMHAKLEELKTLSLGANNLMWVTAAAGHTETALANGVAASTRLLEASEEIYEDFEIRAAHVLGMRRKEQESGNAFIDRLAALSVKGILAAMQRNRIMLVA